MLAHLLTLAAAASPAPKPLPYNAADEAAARAWIAQAGHRFDPAAVLPADLAPLVARLKGAKVIGIGEVTHGTHEDQAFKAELIKALVRAGAIDVLAIECNRAAGAGFDRYVTSGEGDPAALMRSKSFFAIWRNDEFGGLLLWLRAWNQTAKTPVHIIGFDDQDAGRDAEVALDYLRARDPAGATALGARLAPLLKAERFSDWSLAADKAAYLSVQQAIGDLRTRVTALSAGDVTPSAAEARYGSETARQALSIFEGEYVGADKSKLDPAYYSRRDRYMAQNVIARVGTGRAAIWAHDNHVMSALSVADEKQGFSTLGTFVRAAIGERYRTVGFTYTAATLHVVSLPNGARNPPGKDRVYADVPVRNGRPGDFGHVFAALPGGGWWVDLSARPRGSALDRWGGANLWHGFAGWRIDPAAWQLDPEQDAVNPPDRGFDILVWFRRMTPARVWPEPAE